MTVNVELSREEIYKNLFLALLGMYGVAAGGVGPDFPKAWLDNLVEVINEADDRYEFSDMLEAAFGHIKADMAIKVMKRPALEAKG